MNSVITRSLAALALMVGASGVFSPAHARGEVYFYVEQSAPRYAQPSPVYVQPAPVYVKPRHGYVAPGYDHAYPNRSQWNQHAPYGQQRRGAWGDHDGDGVANVHDRDSPFNQRRMAHHYGPYGDIDRDGILNQDDRDRDGDGVRNRYDRFPDDPYRY